MSVAEQEQVEDAEREYKEVKGNKFFRERETETERQRDRERERERQTDRQTDRDRKDRQTDRHTDRQTEYILKQLSNVVLYRMSS